jgi:hypothetical protein
MRAFEIKTGTIVSVIKEGKEWYGPNFEEHETTKDNLFFLEEIAIDPMGHVGTGPQHRVTIGGAYAKAGYYGFLRDGWYMLVPMDKVNIH